MTDAIHHGQAAGIHPGAFVGATAPDTSGVLDHVLWVDTSAGPPYQLKMWDAGTSDWHDIGAVSIGSGGTMVLSGDCVSFPRGAVLCNPSANLVTLITPDGQHAWDATGITLPGGSRLEVVPV